MSPPAQNPRPAPVRTATRMLGSWATVERAAARPPRTPSSMAFSLSGRFSRIVATAPSCARTTGSSAIRFHQFAPRYLPNGGLAPRGRFSALRNKLRENLMLLRLARDILRMPLDSQQERIIVGSLDGLDEAVFGV